MVSAAGKIELILEVTLCAGSAPTHPLTATFGERGGTIGRRTENDWVLPDPERFISGQHALISYSSGEFYLTDTSINGVFLNHAGTPLGKDNRTTLQDGDTLNIGDYEIGVSISQPLVMDSKPDEFDDPFARIMQEEKKQDLDQAFPDSSFSAADSELTEEVEYSLPLDEPESPILESVEDSLDLNGMDRPAESNHVPDLNEYFQQPTPIPEDWDLDADISQHALDKPAAEQPEVQTQPHNQPPWEVAPIAPPEQPITAEPTPAAPAVTKESIPRPGYRAEKTHPPTADTSSVPQVTDAPIQQDDQALRNALAQGLGLPESSFAGMPLDELLENLGRVVRSSTEGTMAILRARTELKGEFRMSQTMIKPVENNPLKFSINAQEALTHILNPKSGGGYLPPLTAIQEANEDIEAHMLAVMVGMQAALKVVLKRFRPEVLEKRLGKSAIIRNVPLYKHAKTWDMFRELYTEIAHEAEDDFHLLFGEAFARAYEEQVRRLASLKKGHLDNHSTPSG